MSSCLGSLWPSCNWKRPRGVKLPAQGTFLSAAESLFKSILFDFWAYSLHGCNSHVLENKGISAGYNAYVTGLRDEWELTHFLGPCGALSGDGPVIWEDPATPTSLDLERWGQPEGQVERCLKSLLWLQKRSIRKQHCCNNHRSVWASRPLPGTLQGWGSHTHALRSISWASSANETRCP